MKRLNIFLTMVLIIGMPFTLLAQGKKDIYLLWDFNDTKKIMDPADEDPWLEVPKQSTREKVKGDLYEITGLGKYVPGVKGNAFKFDGFSSYIEGVPDFKIEDEEIVFPDQITVESWVALGAYPWNWAPILTIGKYKVTGFYFGVDSRGRLGFHMSDATSVWHECNSKINTETGLGMDLGRWHHVVATYSPEEGIKIYLDGKLENSYNDFTFDYGITYSDFEKGFRLGMNRVPLPPTDPIRDWATYPSSYTLDGIIDETKIYSKILSAEEIEQIYVSSIPENEPEFAPRKF
ncbi:MAG: LamG domain-containing protein, partial [Bacteroidales bacterium]